MKTTHLSVKAVRAFACLVTLSAAMSAGPLQGATRPSQPRSRPSGEIILRKSLVIPPVGRYGRFPVPLDMIESRIATGKWSAPKAGDTVKLPDGSLRTWERLAVSDEDEFKHPALRGGYAYFRVDSETRRVMILEASGHTMVYVNGCPRAGDPYRTGFVRLPVLLEPGANRLLFHCGRGRLKARLFAPESPVTFDAADATLPNLVVGEKVRTQGAVMVINASTAALEGVAIAARIAGAETTVTPSGPILPLSVRKVAFRLVGPAPAGADECKVDLDLIRPAGNGKPLAEASVTLRVRSPEQSRKRTFVSGIDGSVQYYAVLPARGRTKDAPAAALFLTLHGASVKAIGQVNAYSPKTWGHVVAPTNRRPFGFDWEDWGRTDAIEALRAAQKRLRTDPRRTYLTGHSMGGHGVWHVGAIFPDRFAAIGPSAAWISFRTYGGAPKYKNPTPVEQVLIRAAAPSETLTLLPNLAHYGVYILHGSKDDNVPVMQSRHMVRQLSGFHRDFAYFEHPDVKHWWNVSPEPGTDCVDWPPMFEFFARRTAAAPEDVRKVSFITVNPGISSRSAWAGIEAQTEQLKPSSVNLNFDSEKRRFVGKTDNVARLSLDLGHVAPGEPVGVELDGQDVLEVPCPEGTERIWLARRERQWSAIAQPSPALKGPHRYGPFKQAFANRVMFVYGTTGTEQENAWSFAKARYDAETFWYRGNGSIDVIPDVDFDASTQLDRNVILYGNAETNAAWGPLLSGSPVLVRGGMVRIGPAKITGPRDLACLFIRPRPGSESALVGVVGGSGITGMRLTNRLPYFVSGVAYPDCIVITPQALTRGSAGVIVAGFFDLDWGVNMEKFAWGAKLRKTGTAPARKENTNYTNENE